jgi:hypothetical protein
MATEGIKRPLFMRKPYTIALAALISVALIFGLLKAFSPHYQLLGNLPRKDLSEIRRVIWKDIRQTELPIFEWRSLLHLRPVFADLRRYSNLRILWIDAKPGKSYVQVVVGTSRETILSDGWDYMVDTNSSNRTWRITGSAYWGGPTFVPADFKIPPR